MRQVIHREKPFYVKESGFSVNAKVINLPKYKLFPAGNFHEIRGREMIGKVKSTGDLREITDSPVK